MESVLSDPAVQVSGVVAISNVVIEELAAKPVPVAITERPAFPLATFSTRFEVAVNVDAVVIVSTVNDSAACGACVTVIAHVRSPWAFVLHAPIVNDTAVGTTAATVGLTSLAAKPVPVIVSNCGNTPLLGVNDHDEVAVNVDVVVIVSTVNDSATFGACVTVIAHVRSPWAFVLHAPSVNVTAPGLTAATVGLPSLAAKPVPVIVSNCGNTPLLGVNDHDEVAVNVDAVVIVSTVNDSATFGACVTVIAHVRSPCAFVLHAPGVNDTAPGLTAATVGVPSVGAKPVPVIVSNCGNTPLLGVNDHDEVAVNVDAVVIVSTVNDSATFGACVTVIAHVRSPWAFVLHAPNVNDTAPGLTAATVGLTSLAAKPVPVAVRSCGSVPMLGVNDHDEVAVNVDAVVIVSTVNDSATFGACVTVIAHVRSPCAFVLHAPSVNVTAVGSTAATVGLTSLAAKPVPVIVSNCGNTPLLGVNDHDEVAVNVDAVVIVSTVNDSATFGACVTVIAHVRSPWAFVLHAPSVNDTAPALTAATVGLTSLAAKPVPVIVSNCGNTPLLGVNDHDEVAVNVDAVVIVSTVNDSATFGACVTVIAHVSVPNPFVLHAPSVNVTAPGLTAATVGLPSLAAKPVPVIVSSCGSVPLLGVNDHDGVTVNVTELPFTKAPASVAVTACNPPASGGTTNVHPVKLPEPSVVQLDCVTIVPPAIANVIAEKAVYWAPLNVTVLPTLPFVELVIVRLGVTVKKEVAVIVPSSVVLACTVYGPCGFTGIVIVQVNEPSAATTTAPSLHARSPPLKMAWTASVAVNPEPVRTVVLPTIPVVGLIVTFGTTVNEKVAVIGPSSVVVAVTG
jgi:hypothetical protein